jgi:hypothetical protein
MTLILVEHETGGIEKFISLSFHAYVDDPNQKSDASCASIIFEGKVVIYSELDSKSDSAILN